MRAVTAALALLVTLAGCREIPFSCREDRQCADGAQVGWCEQNQRCSFPDEGCPSRRRFAAFGTDEACVPVAPACAIAGIAAGGNFTCAWSNNGRVSCWGENASGQLGDGTNNGRSTPAAAGVTGVAELVAGGSHACARLTDGGVSCWGDNSANQLGLGAGMNGNRAAPMKVPGLTGVAALAAGARHTCARLGGGTLACWGRNASGQLGDGTTATRDVPTAVVPAPLPWKEIAAGNSHTCGVLGDGSVSCWGTIKNAPVAPGLLAMQLVPGPLTGLSMVTGLVAGDSHACAISGGQVSCWGFNDVGQAGDRALGRMVGPSPVPNVSGAVDLAAGTNHTCARLDDGSARCWGSGASGQLAAPIADSGSTTVGAPGSPWKQLAAGLRHTCGLTAEGGVYCWGRASEGQLGDGTPLQWLAPDAPIAVARDLTAVSTGAEHSCALTRAGGVVCWGRGDLGQLANGTGASSSTPVAVALPGPVAQIVSGNGFSCARLGDGSAQCWGRGNRGQIGDKTTTDHLRPAPVALPEKIVHLAAGTDHACAVTMTGAVYCWGESGSGRLGSAGATSTAQSKPLLVPLAGEFIQVGAGNTHSCALSRGQQVTCWGGSTYGQAGVGPGPMLVAPTAMTGLPPVTALAIGGDHSCVVGPDGIVRCWGRGDSGQLGFGTTPSGAGLAQPVAIENFGPATALVAASGHSCAVVAGAAFCWGGNRWGQLGHGKAGGSNKPVAVLKLSGVVAIDAGDRHSCAILADGTGYCWGGNQWGQLGNAVVLDRIAPTKVALECP
jgi:alpha-tubulin suppressor-like RCC1 family protein